MFRSAPEEGTSVHAACQLFQQVVSFLPVFAYAETKENSLNLIKRAKRSVFIRKKYNKKIDNQDKFKIFRCLKRSIIELHLGRKNYEWLVL
ncbi:hypothetical protein GOB93_16405 [Acetobacter musti]|uniref:Transposase n=1 Tax=Acetobacter musti TaxID=864732 RepID=A0ABX0JW59_9PROT|nr:hypothetical protein [Acetobacter musti]NHN86210.1 hypothetical protein [Acetobacter musti]